MTPMALGFGAGRMVTGPAPPAGVGARSAGTACGGAGPLAVATGAGVHGPHTHVHARTRAQGRQETRQSRDPTRAYHPHFSAGVRAGPAQSRALRTASTMVVFMALFFMATWAKAAAGAREPQLSLFSVFTSSPSSACHLPIRLPCAAT